MNTGATIGKGTLYHGRTGEKVASVTYAIWNTPSQIVSYARWGGAVKPLDGAEALRKLYESGVRVFVLETEDRQRGEIRLDARGATLKDYRGYTFLGYGPLGAVKAVAGANW